MKPQKPSIVLVCACWASVFIEGWLLLLRSIPADRLSLTLFILFFFLAVMASAVYSSKPKLGTPVADMRVKIGDQVFSAESGNLTMRRNGNIILLSIDPKDVLVLLNTEKK